MLPCALACVLAFVLGVCASVCAHVDMCVRVCFFVCVHGCLHGCGFRVYGLGVSMCVHTCTPHEKLLGILRVSNPVTRKDLADRTRGGSGTNPK